MCNIDELFYCCSPNEITKVDLAEKSLTQVLPKFKVGAAFQHAINHEEKLQIYLEDGNCVISNNTAENSIKPFTIGRKRWRFCEYSVIH